MGMAILIGLSLLSWGIWRTRQAQKYEFENRTSGGVIQFKDFGASNHHRRMKGLAKFSIVVGALVFAIAFSVAMNSK